MSGEFVISSDGYGYRLEHIHMKSKGGKGMKNTSFVVGREFVTSCDFEKKIPVKDLISFGCFDGSIEAAMHLIAAVTFIHPLTWSWDVDPRMYKANTFLEGDIFFSIDNRIRRISFFEKNKFLEGDKLLSIDKDTCWVTYDMDDKDSHDNGREAGFTQISKDDFEMLSLKRDDMLVDKH